MTSTLTTEKAAEEAGINRVTLQAWLRTGRVKPPRLVLRNGRAVRLWSQADMERLRRVKRETYRRGRGRKKKANS